MSTRSESRRGSDLLTALCLSLGPCLTVGMTGCGPANVPQARVIPVVADPLGKVRSFLEGYASGLPVESEREIFGEMIESVREVNPGIAGWLGGALSAIDANPAGRRGLAKQSLERLDREAKAPAAKAAP